MQPFTLWIKFKINWQEFTLLRQLDKYIWDDFNFDFKVFYSENYALFENKDKPEELIYIKQWTVIWYINTDKVNDLSEINDKINAQLSSMPLNSMFFIEWWNYEIYNSEQKIIHKIKINRRSWNFWITDELIPELWDIQFVVYPSKIIDLWFIDSIVNDVNSEFPWVVVGDGWSRFSKNNEQVLNESGFNTIAEYLESTKPFNEVVKYSLNIRKKDFDPTKHNLTTSLESYILSRWWFDKIWDDEILEISEKKLNYNISENQHILWIMKTLKEKYKTKVFDKAISKFEKLGIVTDLTDKLPKKLFQHPIYILLMKFYQDVQKWNLKVKYSIWNMKWWELWTDPIKSITRLYEIYCFLIFKKFLEQLWVIFIDELKSKLYDHTNKEFIRYEDNSEKWFIDWMFKDKKIRLIIWDKLSPENQRIYWLFSELEDLGFINKKFKKVSKDWITPDISMEIWDDILICDVKFSAFRDFDSKTDFPNPDYFMEELQKYRRIKVGWKVISSPILIFYPWDMEQCNIEKFKIMHEFVLKSYNMFLFPIYLGNFEISWFNEFIKESFILNCILNIN